MSSQPLQLEYQDLTPQIRILIDSSSSISNEHLSKVLGDISIWRRQYSGDNVNITISSYADTVNHDIDMAGIVYS